LILRKIITIIVATESHILKTMHQIRFRPTEGACSVPQTRKLDFRSPTSKGRKKEKKWGRGEGKGEAEQGGERKKGSSPYANSHFWLCHCFLVQQLFHQLRYLSYTARSWFLWALGLKSDCGPLVGLHIFAIFTFS